MPVPEVLLVSDDQELVARLADVVKAMGDCRFRAVGAEIADDLERLLSPRPALVVLHHAAHECNSLLQSLLQAAAAQRPRVPAMVVSEAEYSASMLNWMRLGAIDCLSRPLNLGRLSFLIDSFTLNARYAHRSQASNWLELDGVEPFCIASEEMAGLSEQCKRAAIRDANILITGETGTGKTHLAKLIHAMSPRAGETFVTVNCAAIPESLVESELFGHVRGAFTDATRDHEGVFARVGRGTLFLDEVDSLPLASQAKLLHAVDEGAFMAVGASRTQHFQGRLITATNQDLDSLAEQGRFRRDVLFRLKVLHLTIPPLRARRADIPALAQAYIEQSARRQGCLPKPLSAAALDLFQAYDWPGNVREMENVLEQSTAFCLTHEIHPADLPLAVVGSRSASCSNEIARPPAPDACRPEAPLPQAASRLSLEQGRAEGEIQALATALKANHNNRTETARQLGISRSALYKRLRKLGLLVTG